MSDHPDGLIGLTAQIVSAHVSHNIVAPDQLPDLIRRVHDSLISAARGVPEIAPPVPSIPIKQSVKPDAITCLECGKPFSMLKRHLSTDHKLTPDEYRVKWQLPRDYPLVSPNYAKVRSGLAKKSGLGRTGTTPPRVAKRGRKRRAA